MSDSIIWVFVCLGARTCRLWDVGKFTMLMPSQHVLHGVCSNAFTMLDIHFDIHLDIHLPLAGCAVEFIFYF